ncbi:hypothetical protein GQ42DRAFT_171227 [Ramicandelaber brevisporus]|nr:hypothetical protein GQ42DRAFT_171227 [Ramicandelaber brevisporus]
MNLLDLPRDILLYLTDFFDDCEAFPLLTISSQFHDLFARAVWLILGPKTLELDPITRSAALARYGHLVRYVSIRKDGDAFLLYPLNWHLKLPHVVGFCFTINNKFSAEFRRRIFVGIRSLVHLGRLTAFFEVDEAPYTADGLASIIVARHRDPTKRKLIEMTLVIEDNSVSFPWDACLRFCRKLEPLNIQRLGVDGYPTLDIPPPSVDQCRTLAPHLLNLEPLFGYFAGACASQVNGQYFSDKSVVFPLLGNLVLNICCHQREVFDPNCVTPERFSSLRGLHIYETETCVHSVEDFKTACLAIGTRHWPNLKRVMVGGLIDQADLERIFRANPQLTDFSLAYRYNRMRVNRGIKRIVEATMNLERLVHLLPQLQSIQITAPATLRLDYNPQTVSGNIVGRYLETFDIDECSVSPDVLIWLLSLPKLRDVSLENVVLIDPKSALKLIKRIHKNPIQSRSHESVRLSFSTVKLSEECSKVLVEWVAAMPTLESIVDVDASLRQKIHQRCPHIKFTEYDN